MQKKLEEAQKVVEDAGIRRRAMDRKLRDVEVLPEAEAATLLALASRPQLVEDAREAAE